MLDDIEASGSVAVDTLSDLLTMEKQQAGLERLEKTLGSVTSLLSDRYLGPFYMHVSFTMYCLFLLTDAYL